VKRYLHPNKFAFEMPILEPIATRSVVKFMERKREMGCEVEYNIPEWAQLDLDRKEGMKDLEDENREKFEFPFPRHEGVGSERIRKRKEVIPKSIKFRNTSE